MFILTILLTFLHLVLSSEFGRDIGVKSLCDIPDIRQQVLNLYPILGTCYSSTTLYLAQLNIVCSPQCLEATIEGSKFIKQHCKLSNGSGSSILTNNDQAYYKWADEGAARTVCSRGDKNIICLNDFRRVSTQLQVNIKPFSVTTGKNICTECNRSMFYRFKNNPNGLPTLYYNNVFEPDQIILKLANFCGWS